MKCRKTRWINVNDRYFEVPCGKCLACLTNKRNDWAFRLQQEHRASLGACFVTLTYHPKFCPDGLEKTHVQLFMKRLRKRFGKKLRYYAVGEYGTQKTQRPHYHIILFHYDQELRLSTTQISKAWTNRKAESIGIVDIRPLNYARIMYATKYVIDRGNENDNGRAKPFMLCSRAYGLGLNYLSDGMADWHRKGKRNYTLVHGEKRRLPRYYKEKLWYPQRKMVHADPYRNKPKRNGWPEHRDRKLISEISIAEGLKAEEENKRLIRLAGYTDPDDIIEQMRQSVESRVKSKVAYTRIL